MSDNDESQFTLATQGGITFGGNVLGKVLGFLFVAVATRLVTPSEYGLFTLALSIVMFTQGNASLSVHRALDYFIPQFLHESDFGKAKTTVQNVFVIGIATSLFAAFGLFLARGTLATFFGEPSLTAVLPYLVILIPLQTTINTLNTSFTSLKKMQYRVLIAKIVKPLVQIIGLVSLVALGTSLFGLIGGYILGLIAAVSIGIFLLFYEAEWLRHANPTQISNRTLLSYSLPLLLAGVIYTLVGQIDYFVIGYYLTPTDVGQYRVAYLLAGNLLIVLRAITPIFKPMVAENQNDHTFLEDHYQLSTRWITILTLPLAITLILAPKAYLSLFFTSQYASASTSVVALSLGYLINSSFGPEGMLLEGLGRTRLTFVNSMILVGVNGGLDILLVPHIGIVGAAVATGAALAVAGLIGTVEIYILRSITAFNTRLVRVWIAALIPLTLGWAIELLNMGTLFTALSLPIVVCCSYLIGVRFTGGFSSEDHEIASRIDRWVGYPVMTSAIPSENN